MNVIGFLLTHRTRLDGLGQKFVDSIRRLMETGVTFLQWPFRLVRHLVLKYKRLLFIWLETEPECPNLFMTGHTPTGIVTVSSLVVVAC